MTERVRPLLDRADRALVAARRDLGAGDAESAVDHAYYAMFYAASACLEQDGLRFKKHSATHAAFGMRFAKTARLDPVLHRWLLQAFNLRTTATYDVERAVDREGVKIALERAASFVEAVARFLAKAPLGPGAPG
jgi:uncharacterized protein (UPF0332 family)